MEHISGIAFPNTVRGFHQSRFFLGQNCDEIRKIEKNGEMAKVTWFQIIRDHIIICEIKESVCDVLGCDTVPEYVVHISPEE